MKKGLSLILAIAMVFSMFASVAFAAEAPADAGKYLQELKVIKGDANGDLMADADWTRQDVAVILSRLLGKEDVAKATAKAHTFADVKDSFYDGYLSWALANGYMKGHSATEFGFGESITNQQFAAVVLRALGVDNYDKAIELAVEKGILPAGVKADANAKRGETYTAIVAALNVEVGTTGKKLGEVLGLPGFVVVAPAVDFKVVGAKKIEVTFNKAVDTAAAKIEVTKGSFPANVSKVTWNDAKTVATVELAAKMTKGDYTVKVAGVADVSKVLSVLDEKVEKVQFLGEKAPVVAGSSNLQVTVRFAILNQYGEDITDDKDTSTTFTAGKGTAALSDNNNYITITAGSAFTLEEPLFVSALYSDGAANQVFAQANLKVGISAQVAKLTVEKLTHKTDSTKAISVNNDVDDFAVVVKGEDQYGQTVGVDVLEQDVIVSSSNNGILTPETYTVGSATYSQFTNGAVVGYTSNQNYLELNQSADAGATNWKAGTTVLYFYSKTTGAQASLEVKVADVAKVDTFTMDQPAIAVVGEKNEIPFTAVDQYGNAINSADTLKAAGAFTSLTVSGVTGVTYSFEQDYVNNKAKLYLDSRSASELTTATNVYIYAYTSTGKQVNLTVALQPRAKASVVSAVADMSFAVAQGGSTSLEYDDISVYDQYGRTKKLSDFTGAGYYAKVAIDNDKITSDAATITSGNTDVSFAAPANKEGTAVVTLTLNNGTADVAGSEFKFNVRNVKLNEIADYEVADIAKLYADNTMTQSVTVTGLLADGTKVALPTPSAEANDYYTVTDATYVNYNNGTVQTQGTINFGSETEKTYKIVVVTTNKDGAQKSFAKDVVVSNVAPTAAKLELKSTTSGVVVTNDSAGILSVSKSVVNAATKADLALAGIKITDQYGKTTTITSFDNVIVSGFSNSTRTTLADVNAGDTFSLTAISGSQSITAKVVVKQ